MTTLTTARLLLAWTLSVAAVLAADPQTPVEPAPQSLIRKPALSYVNDETPDWLTLSGEFRFRYEGRQGLGYVEGNDDHYGLARTRINIGVKPTPWMQFFFQGQDSRAPGIRAGATNNGVFRDPFEVRQAYVKIGGGESAPVGVTVGRQLLVYGDQRLIGALDWTNTSRAFDAVRLEVKAREGVKFDVFSASVVQNNPNRRINQSVEGNNLHGIYGRLTKLIPKATIEPYVLWQTVPVLSTGVDLVSDHNRFTGGVRIWAKRLKGFDYNVAVAKQWGNVSLADIDAWGAYGEVGYTVKAPWSPRVYAEYTFGSGDSDATDGKIGGFVDLFPTAHLWYGYNDLVGWRNLKNGRIGLQMKPHSKVGLRFDYHSFWLANKNDGLYNVAGASSVAAVAGGAADTKIGDEFDATITMPITKLITLGGGVGHMFPGPFLEANTPGGSNNFTFLFTSFKF
jgi:hypothetical protein